MGDNTEKLAQAWSHLAEAGEELIELGVVGSPCFRWLPDIVETARMEACRLHVKMERERLKQRRERLLEELAALTQPGEEAP